MATRRLSAVPDGDDARGAAARVGADVSQEPAEELLHRVALGDSHAFEALYDRYAAQVFGIVVCVVRDRDQSEEVAQEVFIEVWRRASRFDPARGSASAWVMALAHSRAVDRVRSAQAAAEREVRDGISSPDRDFDSVAETVDARMEQAAVRRCLSTLTELQRQSVTLAYYAGYTYPQVAALLHTALPTVKTRIRDGLIRLRDCLGVSR